MGPRKDKALLQGYAMHKWQSWGLLPGSQKDGIQVLTLEQYVHTVPIPFGLAP